MDYDYTEALKVIKKLREYFLEVAEEIKKVFDEHKHGLTELLKTVQAYYSNEDNKIKYKPVLKIKLKKEIVLDKRVNRYYCRNTC